MCKANQMKMVLEGQTSAMEDRRSPRLRHQGLDYGVSVLADFSRSAAQRNPVRFVSYSLQCNTELQMSAALQTNLHRNVALESLGGVPLPRQMCRSRGAAPAGGRKTFHFDFEGSKFNLRISESAHPSVPRNHGVPFSKATLRPPQRVEAGDGVHGEASESEEEGSAQRRSRGENHYNDEIRE